MITFKEYLDEAAITKTPMYKKYDIDEAVKIYKTKCSDATWMAIKDKPLYRGESQRLGGYKAYTVNPALTRRQSENTTNYYTTILDNNPLMNAYPKRSRSFVCSTRLNYTQGFGDPYVVIPYNGVKIGVCSGHDLWRTRVTLFGIFVTINRMNDYWEDIPEIKPSSWRSFLKFAGKLEAGDEKAIEVFRKAFEIHDMGTLHEFANQFITDIYKAYSPQSLEFDVCTTKDIHHNLGEQEVWVGGPVLMIEADQWHFIRDAIRDYKEIDQEEIDE
jgi:hypothetical protein